MKDGGEAATRRRGQIPITTHQASIGRDPASVYRMLIGLVVAFVVWLVVSSIARGMRRRVGVKVDSEE